MRRISTPEAPKAVGPYSQGVLTGYLLYASGQVALNTNGELVNDSVESEVHQIMRNLDVVLGTVGCRFSDVVKSTIYITEKELFPTVNAAYGQYFKEGKEPTRECVVASPPLSGAHVEISMIAETGRLVSGFCIAKNAIKRLGKSFR